MKKRLAFVDHSFHRKSKATSFLIDLLIKYYDVKVFWDEAWNGKSPTSLKELSDQNYDTIIVFQQINYREKELNLLKGKNIIFIPMYDESGGLSNKFWVKYKNFKIINFSKHLHNRLTNLGLNSKYFQYFPPIHNFNPPKYSHNKLSGVFWQRTNQITWNQQQRQD